MTNAFLDVRPAIEPEVALPAQDARLLRLFGLDRMPAGRPVLVCRWHRLDDGRLARVWEPDLDRAR